MKQIYTLLLAAVMLFSSLTAGAWSYDLPLANDVLSEQYGYAMFKDYDFYNGITNVNDYFTRADGERCSGDGCFTVGIDAASVKINGFDAFQVVEPVEMTNFFLQIGTGAINLRAGVNKDGLHNYGSGSRFFAIADVKAGQILVCQWGLADASRTGNVVQPSDKISGADACQFTDITSDIHSAQMEATETSDNFNYWKAESDGYFVIEMQRGTAIQGLQIWIDASAPEAVSSPTISLKGVNMSERELELTAGESTLGYACSTYYGIVDLGEEPLYLIDTDEVLSTDTINVLDEEGNIVDQEIKVTYKKVINPEEIANGSCGEHMYDGSYIMVSSEDDVDGDGYVTIAAATVSESYEYSDIVYQKVSVGEITLNAPTMTLTGLNGVNRQYQVGWTNNTLCGEEFQLTAVVDGEEQQVNIGDYVEAESDIAASVHAEGYNDGVLDVADVLEVGVEFYRKDAEKAAAEQHDWDFVNLTTKQKKLLQGTWSETVGILDAETNDTIKYSVDEFMALVAEGKYVEEDAIALDPVYSGWEWDAGRGRGTLGVVRDTTWTSETEYTIATTYVEDKIGFYPTCNGITFNCPPNAANNSTVLLYGNGDLGIYFMSRPTLTFSREAAQYGEYVLIYQGQGGSNYTNSRWPSLYEVPAEELLTLTLANGGIHVFYIDVYTREELPTDGVANVTERIQTDNAVYDLSGRRITLPAKGLYIKSGKKYFVK